MPSHNCNELQIYRQHHHGNSNNHNCSSTHHKSTTCNHDAPSSPQLPLEVWFQILTQALNLLLPTATTPRTYSTYILPLLLTSHTFHEHCHPVTFPHLRKHKLLQLFTRWKAAHSREVHFYHHPLTARVRYALPDRVGNPPGEEYETLYSFIKRAYLFGCESVCGTVIPVEGGLEGVATVAQAQVPVAAQAPAVPTEGQHAPTQTQAPEAGTNGQTNATATTISTPASAATGVTTPGNVVVAPPVAPPIPAAQVQPAPINHQQHGGDGGQGWKGHALQWHVANPTFAADGTIELYREVVEEYRRVVCGSAASQERSRALELTLDRMKNPHRYMDEVLSPTSPMLSTPSTLSSSTLVQDMANEELAQEGDAEYMDEDDERQEDEGDEDEEDEEEEEEDEEEQEVQDMIDQDEYQLLNEIEAKGGLRRRDSGHGQSSSEMDIDEDADDELEDSCEEILTTEDMAMDSDIDTSSSKNKIQTAASSNKSVQQPQPRPRRNAGKREPDTMVMDYELAAPVPENRQRRGGLRSQSQASSRQLQQQQKKMERSYSTSDQERIIMDMSLDKPYHTMNSHRRSPSPLHLLERPSSAASCSSSSSSERTRSGSPGPLTPLSAPPSLLKLRGEKLMRTKSSPRLALQRSHSSPAAAVPQVKSGTQTTSRSTSSLASPAVTSGSAHSGLSEPTRPETATTATSTPSTMGPFKAEDLGFDLASACANTFASDLAFVLARVPGLGAHFHRFEQLAKLKLHVGWAKHAQSRGGNDVFVMSCSRLIAILAPLANTPLVSERGGGVTP